MFCHNHCVVESRQPAESSVGRCTQCQVCTGYEEEECKWSGGHWRSCCFKSNEPTGNVSTFAKSKACSRTKAWQAKER